MECERASWIYCLSTLKGTEAYLPHTVGQKNNITCLQETHGKDESLQAIHVLHTQFRMFGTFTPNNVNAGGSAILVHKDLLPDHAIVSHEITCQGRDHVVTIRSG